VMHFKVDMRGWFLQKPVPGSRQISKIPCRGSAGL
jgi:hypothetical protein